MATYSSILAWKIPWIEDPGRLHTVRGVAKNWTRLSDFTQIKRVLSNKDISLSHRTMSLEVAGLEVEKLFKNIIKCLDSFLSFCKILPSIMVLCL